MTESAPNYQTIQSASTQGLEDLFLHSDSDAEQIDSQLVITDSHLILTVAEASVHLKIPASTLYRHIRAGKFKTRIGQDGTVRIVLPAETTNENHVIITKSFNENQNQPMILTDYQSENRCDQTELDRLLRLLADKDRKLEAATYRVGFLESQLAERQKDIADRDTAIKLLTDSQQKLGPWARFKKWLLGQ